MYCPSCGKAIADGSAFCMHCGKTTGLTSGSRAIPTKPTFPAGAPVCPNCGQIDAVQNVMGIIAAGTSTGTVPSTQVGQLGGYVVSSTVYKETYSSTVLAQTFMKAMSWDSRAAAATRQMRPEPRYKEYREAEAYIFWAAEQQFRCGLFLLRFQRVHYCARCTGVFVPLEGDFAPMANINALVFKQPVASNYDICEVEAGFAYMLEGSRKSTLFLIAQAFGVRGYYVAKVVKWQEGLFKYHTNQNPPELKGARDALGVPIVFPSMRCNDCINGHNVIVQQLANEGWERTNESSEQWWQVRFRRPPNHI